MATTHVQLQRFSVTSQVSFDDVLKGLTATIGRPAMSAFLLAARHSDRRCLYCS